MSVTCYTVFANLTTGRTQTGVEEIDLEGENCRKINTKTGEK
jgi:hypothetical protein